MDFSDLDEAVAAVAHRCWCKHMLSEGWRAGKVLDPEAREHDKIRPYKDLPVSAQSQLKRQVRWDKLEEALATAMHHAMMEPEFTADTVYIGMRVMLLDDPEGHVGRVVGWEVGQEPGLLETLRVEWPDGEIVEYASDEVDLAPVDDAGV